MHTQQSSLLTKFVGTCLKLSQDGIQQSSQWLQLNSLRAAATCAAASSSPLHHQEERRRQQWPQCNSSFLIPYNSCQRSVPPSTALLRPYSKFTAAREPATAHGSIPLCEERAHDLIANLKDSERDCIKVALAKFEAMTLKEGFEGKLAATQWRTRFGRGSTLPVLGDVDPTGSFCAFPDDWLKKKAAEKAKEPTSQDLWKIFFVNAVPFVGFGFLDNFTMIIAGDYIEYAFGTFMCISTMAAAGLGNTISDVLGIGSAYYIERGCEVMGLRPPDLTPIQMEMKSSRKAANYGRLIGITVGCLVGMFPLLFMDKKPPKSAEAVAAAVPSPAPTPA